MRSTVVVGVVVGMIALLGSCSLKHKTERIFGVGMGEPLSSLKQVKLRKDYPLSSWYAFEPTEPNSAFSQYQALVTPKHGVCGLSAESMGSDQGDHHSVEPDDFAAVLKAMTAKYGKPVAGSNGFSGQFARNNYSWNKVKYRNVPPPNTVDGIWMKYDPDAILPDGIRAIMLSYFPSNGAAEVWYQSKDWDDCIREAQASGL
jgi:hypothetical protein